MFSVTTSPALSSAAFLSTSPVYCRKQIHKGVGHNWRDSTLQKQFCHQRNCNWNDIHETTKQPASAGITQKRSSTTLCHFSLHCSWRMGGPWFMLLNQEYSVLHHCCTTPTDKRMLQRCWCTFVYKQKSRDKLQCWLPYIPLISNHCLFKKTSLFSHLKPIRKPVRSNDRKTKHMKQHD